jgi:hypothetical protein
MKIESQKISMIALFATLGVVVDIIVTPGFSSGIWFGWIFIISPLAGIILGPYNGFLATFIAVMLGHYIVPRETIYEFIFTLGAPICSIMSGLIFRGNWKKVLTYFTLMFMFFFVTPISWSLPVWGMWDVYITYFILLFFSITHVIYGSNKIKGLSQYGISALIGLEADILLRIIILVPLGAYQYFFGFSPEVLVAIWSVPAPLITPFKVFLSTFITIMVGPQAHRVIKAIGLTQIN